MSLNAKGEVNVVPKLITTAPVVSTAPLWMCHAVGVNTESAAVESVAEESVETESLYVMFRLRILVL